MAETSEELKKYTLQEVAEHNEKKSVWVLIHDNIYDVTKFLEEHPGGEEVLIEQAGRDATEAFEDVGHSSDARDLMRQYKIGELVEEDKKNTKKVAEKKIIGVRVHPLRVKVVHGVRGSFRLALLLLPLFFIDFICTIILVLINII